MNKEITIYHPNARGTGSAMRVTFCDFCGHDRNYVQIEIAPQSSIGDTPFFDWSVSLHEAEPPRCGGDLSRHCWRTR